MGKIVIIYFSGTGNTFFTSKVLYEELIRLGLSADMLSIEDIDNGDFSFLQGAEMVVFAYPIYGSDLPSNMMKFIKNLPHRKKPVMTAVLCTQALFSGDGDTFIGEYLNHKGYRVFRTMQVNICSNLAIPVFNQILKPLFGADLRRKKYKASLKIRLFAKGLAEASASVFKPDPFFIAGGIIQRTLFRISGAENYFKFDIDLKTCTGCGLCVKNCPVENIELRDNGIIMHDKCIFCMRCFNICPTYSINLGASTKNVKTYRRFLSEKSILK